MRLDRRKIVLAISLLLLIALAIFSDQKDPPQETFHYADQGVFGSYVLHQVWARQSEQPAQSRFYTLSESDSLVEEGANLLIMTKTLELAAEDWQVLRRHLKQGGRVLIAAEFFGRRLRDSLEFYLVNSGLEIFKAADSLNLFREEAPVHLHPDLPFGAKHFSVPAVGLGKSFSAWQPDSSSPHYDLAWLDGEKSILRHYQIGEGHLFLCSAPALLSNFYWLDEQSSALSNALLSLLPASKPLYHYEYYHLGRMEANSPLRFVLSEHPLKMAVYFSLAGILLFFLFATKRLQRPVPAIKPPENQSMAFVKTLGGLHYRTRNHLRLMKKRNDYLRDKVMQRYRIRLGAGREQAFDDLQRILKLEKALMDRLRDYFERVEPADEALIKQQEKDYNHIHQRIKQI